MTISTPSAEQAWTTYREAHKISGKRPPHKRDFLAGWTARETYRASAGDGIDISEATRAILASGGYIQAIRQVRIDNGASLADAKRAVDAIRGTLEGLDR